MIAVLATAATEPNAGWGKLVALLVTAGVFWAGATIHQRYLAVKDQPLSPAGDGVALEGVKSQASTPADPNVTPSEKGSPAGAADLDGFVAQHVGSARPTEIIREARRKFGKSESTVKRAIRRARGGQS